MKNSRRDLFIDMVAKRFIFNNNQITLFPCFTFIHEKKKDFVTVTHIRETDNRALLLYKLQPCLLK